MRYPAYAELFEASIVRPLKSVPGRRLAVVEYVALELIGLEVADPNTTGGCQAVRLRSGAILLEGTAGWALPFRQGGIGHHIQCENIDAAAPVPAGSIALDASHASPWLRLMQGPVLAVEVYGIGDSPQAICFQSQDAVATIAAGYSGDPPDVGDGDEILVFEGKEPLLALQQRLWTCEAGE